MAAAIAYVERTRGRLRVCCLSWIDSLAQHPRLRGGHTVLLRVVANVAAVAGTAFGMASHAAEHVGGILFEEHVAHGLRRAAIRELVRTTLVCTAPRAVATPLRPDRLSRYSYR